MSRFTYYSPLLAGFALAALMHDTLWGGLGQGRLSENMHWVVTLLVGAAFAAGFQILMVGSQGVFAQVLPLPGGRSIRGGLAMLGGASLALTVIAVGVALALGAEEIRGAMWFAASLAVLSGIGAGLCFAWGWPTAARDFADR